MKKNGTALNPGQQAEFLSTAIKQLVLLSCDSELDPATADSWARNGEGFKRALRRELIPPRSKKGIAKGVVKIVHVKIGGGRTTDQIVETTKAKNKIIYINSNINQTNMPSGNGRERTSVLEFFEFDHDPTTEKVRVRCEEPGYGYSTYEDGLRFQEDHEDHLDDQKDRSFVFIPENPWLGSGDGCPRALDFWSNAGTRRLDLIGCLLEGRWPRRCFFARRKYII